MVTLVTTVLIAGAFSTVAFDFFGKSLSPMLGFGGLAPVPLANGVIKTLFGTGYTPGAHALHYFAGMIAYPAGWVLIAEPLRRRFAPQVHWLIAATVYGVALWVWALFFMAHLVAGNPPFLGWGTITWVALVGHVLFALITAMVAHLRRNA
ncbi:hypothetical protein IU397_03730 [Actibacterium sp. 188UL27-1]|nr:hypothetical protein [Actibacterium sp. 188UL27-1]